MAATPYPRSKPSVPKHFDLEVAVFPMMIINGKHHPLHMNAMAGFVNEMLHNPSWTNMTRDILGEPPVAALSDTIYNAGEEYVTIIYRVSTPDDLNTIWKLYEDQTLDQRLTQAIAKTPFPNSIGLPSQQLYIEFMIDERSYYLAKANLTPTRTRSRMKLAQGSPTSGSWATNNPSFLPGMQNFAVPIKVEHQNEPMGSANTAHIVEPPNGGQFTPTSHQPMMSPPIPFRQCPRGEPEGHASPYTSMSEEEHVAVNFSGGYSSLNRPSSAGPAQTEAPNTENVGHFPESRHGYEDTVNSARALPQTETFPVTNTEPPDQFHPHYHAEGEINVQHECWSTPPNSPGTQRRTRSPERSKTELPSQDGDHEEKRKKKKVPTATLR